MLLLKSDVLTIEEEGWDKGWLARLWRWAQILSSPALATLFVLAIKNKLKR